MSHIKKEEVTIESEGGESLSLFFKNSTECSKSIFDYSGVWGMFTNKQIARVCIHLPCLQRNKLDFKCRYGVDFTETENAVALPQGEKGNKCRVFSN